MHDCPSKEVLEQYVQHSMNKHEWDRVHQHVNQCDPCTTAISDIEKGLEVTQTLPPLPHIKPHPPELHANKHDLDAIESSDQYMIKSLDIPDYKLIKRIGKGGFGEVWIAQPLAGPHCAVKVFPKSTLKATEFEGLKTYRNLVSGHPNLVQVLHVGETQSHYYYVMELADGYNTTPIFSEENYEPRSLNKDLHRNGPCGFDKTIEYIRQILAGLKRLHQEELLHRDIKPANLIFVGGVLKLADIGLITKEDRRGSNAMTRAYAPPEGIQDRSGDLYCLGKTLFEMITGAQPHTYPDWPTAKNPQQEAAFNKLKPLIDKACSEKPEDRYQTVNDFSTDLEKLTTPSTSRWLKRNKHRVMTITSVIILVAGYFIINSILFSTKIDRLLIDAEHYFEMEQWYDAVNTYTEVLTLDLDNHAALCNKAISYINIYNDQYPNGNLKHLSVARELCDHAIRVTPAEHRGDILNVLNVLGSSSRKIQEYNLAEEYYRKGILIVENDTTLLNKKKEEYTAILEGLGIVMTFTNRIGEAEVYFEQSANLMGTNTEYCDYSWRHLSANKLYSSDPSCRADLGKAAQCKKDDPLRMLLEARMYLEIEPYIDIQKAKDKIIAALEITDSNYVKSKAKRLQALIYLHNEEYQLANDHAIEARVLGDNQIINYFILAIAQYHTGSNKANTSYELATKHLDESVLSSRDYIVELQQGTLWIDSAEQVSQLRLQAEKLLFTSKTAP